jgi:hypothetical protein
MEIKHKLVLSILLATLFTNILSITHVDAQKPVINHEESKRIWGLCESTDYGYDVYVSKITNYQKDNTRYYVLLFITDKTTGITTSYDSSDVDMFHMNMNHGKTMFQVNGKPFIVEWTATGDTQVTMEKYEIPYQGKYLWHVIQVEYMKTQGTCTVFYDNDIASGTVGLAGHKNTQYRIVPTKE